MNRDSLSKEKNLVFVYEHAFDFSSGCCFCFRAKSVRLFGVISAVRVVEGNEGRPFVSELLAFKKSYSKINHHSSYIVDFADCTTKKKRKKASYPLLLFTPS